MEISHDEVYGMVKSGISVGAALFANAAVQWDGATVTWLGSSKGVIQTDKQRILVDTAVLNETALGGAIVQDKQITKDLLRKDDIRTPQGDIATSEDEAVDIAKKLGKSVVVKPSRGGMGKGVSVDLVTEGEIRDAYQLAEEYNKGAVLVEEYINIDNEYRCMASDTACVAVVHRVLPDVLGDGHLTVRELIALKNEKRKENAAMYHFPIPIDTRTTSTLERQGVTLDTVLSEGAVVRVSNVGGLSGGAEPHEVLDKVSDEVKELAKRSISAIPKLNWGGVDIVTEKETGIPYVIEINVCAGYGAATYPVEGTPRDVASYAWHRRLEISQPDNELPSIKNLPAIAEQQPTLAELYPKVNFRRNVLASGLLPIWAEQYGYRLRTRGTLSLIQDGKRTQWVTSGLATSRDLLAPRRILGRHTFVTKLLDLDNLPRPTARLTRSTEYLQDILRNQSGASIVMPGRDAWQSSRARVFRGPLKKAYIEKMYAQSKTWLVQAVPGAHRLRILASRDDVLSTLCLTATERPVEFDQDALSQASLMAIHAVRAIPELMWAFVDVALDLEDEGPYIEGLSCNPALRGSDRIISGNFGSLFETLLLNGEDDG